MANYWITNNAKFRPFSYDEMIRPVEKMYTEHKGIEEGLAELQTKAGIWEGLANEQTDPVTYTQYKRYADELRMAADDLAMNGLNARSRQNLYNMKARYASEITPIEVAYNRREKLAEEQRKLNAQSGFNTRFDVDFSTASLDKLLANPQISYTGINGDEVVKRTSQMASSIAKAISRMPEFVNTNNKDINKQYFMQRMQQGATLEEVLAEITGREDAPKELSLIRNTIKSQLIDNPAYDEKWVNALINQGMYSAIGSAQYDLINNKDFISRLQAEENRRANAKLILEQNEYHQKYDAVRATLPDGTEGYADSRGYFTKDADGNKHYRYDLATSSGKPVSSSTLNAANMTAEKTAKGIPTGRYYDSKTQKYYNSDGSICANQRKLTPQEEAQVNQGGTAQDNGVTYDISKNPYKPFKGLHYTRNYFDGTFGGGWSGKGTNEGFDPKDAELRTFESLSREPNKDMIVEDLASYGLTVDDVDIYQDYDWYNDDHWRIVPKGAKPSWRYGEPVPIQSNAPASSNPAPQDSVTVPQDSIPLIPDSIPLTNDMFGNKGS